MKAMKTIGIIIGVLLIIGGISCMVTPSMTYVALAWVAGISMVADAIGNIATWSSKKKEKMADGWDLLSAFISLLFGAVLISSTMAQILTAVIMTYIVAAWIIVKGVIRIIASLKIRQINKALGAKSAGRSWVKILALGVLMTACGILCMVHPGVLMSAIGIFVGISIISSGINLITFASAKAKES